MELPAIGDFVSVDDGFYNDCYEQWPDIQDCWLLRVTGYGEIYNHTQTINVECVLPASLSGQTFSNLWAWKHINTQDINDSALLLRRILSSAKLEG